MVTLTADPITKVVTQSGTASLPSGTVTTTTSAPNFEEVWGLFEAASALTTGGPAAGAMSKKMLVAAWGGKAAGGMVNNDAAGGVPEAVKAAAATAAAKMLQGVAGAAGGLASASADPVAVAMAARGAARSGAEDVRKAVAEQKAAWSTLDKRIETFQKEIPADVSPVLPPPPPTKGDAFKTISDLSAAWADTLTGGMTSLFRQQMNYDDAVDYNSVGYAIGQNIGMVHNIAMGFGGAAGGALGVVQKAMNLNNLAQGTAAGAQSIANGDYAEGFLQIGTALMLGTRGLKVCGMGRAVVGVNRVIMGTTAVLQTASGLEKLQDGDYFGGAVDLFSAGLSTYQASKACFVAGTPMRGEYGSRPVWTVVLMPLLMFFMLFRTPRKSR